MVNALTNVVHFKTHQLAKKVHGVFSESGFTILSESGFSGLKDLHDFILIV